MILEARNIAKSFGPLQVLKGVDFTAAEGEVVAIMGASGAGKSTLLQILGTLLSPDGGSLVIDGTEVVHLGEKALSAFRNRRIGFVFQAHHLLPEFSALENVMIPALIGGEESKKARARALELLETVGLQERVSHKPSELSGGEQQRVAIASVLTMNPEILVLDEPTSNLDPLSTEEIFEIICRLNREMNMTVILVEHEIELMAKYVDRFVVMDNGRIVLDGTPREVFSHKDVFEQIRMFIPTVTSLAGVIDEEYRKWGRHEYPITLEDMYEIIDSGKE